MPEIHEKDRILNSAEDKFLSQGFSKVTVDELAADLGMSKKTIYKFFPSKEDIMRAIMRMIMKRIERQVTTIVESDQPFEQKFTEFLGMLARLTSRIGKQFQKDIKRHMPELEREMETFRREKVFGKLIPLFQQAKAEGFLREDLNVEIFMLVFTNAVQGIMTPSVLAMHSFSAEEAFRQIFRVLFEGILTNDARQRFNFFTPSQGRL
ncbi:MAG: TetR family transcriptional regulator [Bacteroidia bacterium]|nr:MAG: TetR family transcriptional regulator [Bacteroidia bacterium]